MCSPASFPGGMSSSCRRACPAPPSCSSMARTGIRRPALMRRRCGAVVAAAAAAALLNGSIRVPGSSPSDFSRYIHHGLLSAAFMHALGFAVLLQSYAVRTPAGHPVHENFRVHAFKQARPTAEALQQCEPSRACPVRMPRLDQHMALCTCYSPTCCRYWRHQQAAGSSWRRWESSCGSRTSATAAAGWGQVGVGGGQLLLAWPLGPGGLPQLIPAPHHHPSCTLSGNTLCAAPC